MSDFHIWSGVYPDFSQAPAEGEGFSSSRYRERTLAAAREALASFDRGEPIAQFHKQRCVALPPLVCALMERQPAISILDFGGGMGIGYLTLSESIPGAAERIAYDIVEVPAVSEIARSLYEGRQARPRFLDTLPPSGERFDLIFSASALQYIPDWRGMLRRLAEYDAPWVLLSDVFAGDIPTFATVQNYYESRIPHWFLNGAELEALMREAGYLVRMKADVHARRLDRDDTVPMENFPEHLRLRNTWHLLFAREGPGDQGA